MNDQELDEILNTWSAPPPPTSLRENVRTGFAATLERKTTAGRRWRWITGFARKSLLAGALVGVGAFLFLVAQAFPQTLRLFSPAVKIPYTVDSEFVQYAEDGSSAVDMYVTSYNDNGRESILSKSYPGHPLRTVLGEMLALWQRIILPFVVSAELRERVTQARAEEIAARIRAGCLDGQIIGRETILNHPTVASQFRGSAPRRITVWMAPDLGCFPLRITVEEPRPDGTFRLVTLRQALRVTVNP